MAERSGVCLLVELHDARVSGCDRHRSRFRHSLPDSVRRSIRMSVASSPGISLSGIDDAATGRLDGFCLKSSISASFDDRPHRWIWSQRFGCQSRIQSKIAAIACSRKESRADGRSRFSLLSVFGEAVGFDAVRCFGRTISRSGTPTFAARRQTAVTVVQADGIRGFRRRVVIMCVTTNAARGGLPA